MYRWVGGADFLTTKFALMPHLIPRPLCGGDRTSPNFIILDRVVNFGIKLYSRPWRNAKIYYPVDFNYLKYRITPEIEFALLS